MSNALKIAHMIFDDLSPADQVSFYAWMGKQVPVQENDAPLESAALWWLAKLKSGNVVPGAGWPTMLRCEVLVDDYVMAIKRNLSSRGNATAMGRFLETVGAVEKKKPSIKVQVTAGAKPRRWKHYVFHDLGECRAAFEAKYGPQDWMDVDDAQEVAAQCPDGD